MQKVKTPTELPQSEVPMTPTPPTSLSSGKVQMSGKTNAFKRLNEQ